MRLIHGETMNLDTQERRRLPRSRAAYSLADMQNPGLLSGEHPSRTEVNWPTRIDPLMDVPVSPLLQHSHVPFQKSEKGKAHKSAVFYSECFLRGIAPGDADKAAGDVDSQYKKWWVDAAFHEEAHDDPVLTAKGGSVGSDDSQKRKHGLDLQEDHDYESPHQKRRKRRDGVRHVIDHITIHQRRLDQSSHSSEPGLSSLADENHGEAESETQVAQIPPHDDDATTSSASLKSPTDAMFSIHSILNLSSITRQQVEGVRDEVLDLLKRNGGDVDHPTVRTGLTILESFYLSSDLDARRVDSNSFPFELDGTWLTLSKPTYSECRGRNKSKDPIYSLGRMSFDMFRPTNLLCSIQGIFNTVQVLETDKGELPFSIPKKIKKELGKSLVGGAVKGLRSYNIVVALTIEPNQTTAGQAPSGTHDDIIRRPIRGIMTNYGYILPDPHVPNRQSVWFTGGSLEVNDDLRDLEEWKKIFGGDVPHRDMSEFARVLAAKVLLGAMVPDHMEENGNLNYLLKRPIGGHGTAFCDVLYMDEKLRVIRGHNGSVFVFRRVQSDSD